MHSKRLVKQISTFVLAEVLAVTAVNVPFSVHNFQEIQAAVSETVLKTFDFEKGIDGWYYGNGWEYQYSGAENSSVNSDNGKLKATVDYSADSAQSWSQMAICYYQNGLSLTGLNHVTVDFYYEAANLRTGSFKVKLYSNSGVDIAVSVDTDKAVDVGDGIYKVPLVFDFTEITNELTPDLSFCIIGSNTDYKGDVWLDNVKLSSISDSDSENIYVNSTLPVTGGANQLAYSNGNLTTYDKNGNLKNAAIASNVTMADKNATAEAKAIYAYLQAIGTTDSVIYGHQNDTHHKAGALDTSTSDTYDVTGSYSGVIGIDTLSLTGDEYSAKRYNNEIAKNSTAEQIDENAAGNVKAAARLTNRNIAAGSIITLSSHMPNFSMVKENNSYQEGKDKTYAKYDFSGYTPNVLTGDVANKILPGGEYNEMYNAYLDMIADYASQVNGAILFRPFHENTGSWFWWGAAFCDAETYKNIYRYTVEYLRDEKNIHNLIYVYGPGSESANVAEYESRYPGDEYVDMVGFDMYNSDPAENNDTWYTSFQNELDVVNAFAKQHNKLFAVTETGVSTSKADKGDSQTALHKQNNQQKDWYNKIMEMVSGSDASYFLLWANFGKTDGFYSPYVESVNEDGTLYGHEMLDNFIDFFNDPRSVFAVNQKKVLSKIDGSSITADAADLTGYFTAPVAGSRILEATTLTARTTGTKDSDVVTFRLNGNGVTKNLTAQKKGSYYSANLDAETLDALGEYVGSMELLINGTVMQKISATYNIPEPAEDPYCIDNFEDYYGVDSLLTKKWSTNKASGSTISISLTNEDGKYNSGSYGLKMSYSETSGGWAGATISKEVDWSSCNALQFYTKPDGNKQKYVIQITANGTVYEAYLNLYEAYANSTEPMLVTIPFAEFCQRDTDGNPKGGLVNDKSSINSFGLWVNAIDGTEAIASGTVTGTIYYDSITAVKSDVTEATFVKLNETPVTSQTPVTSETPVTSQTPVTSETPATSQTPVTSETPATSQTPAASEAPVTSEPQNVITKLKYTLSNEKTLANKKLTALINSVRKKTSSLKYTKITVSGTITSKTKKIKVNTAELLDVKNGSKVYVYYYNSDKNQLSYLNNTIQTVGKDGYITMNLSRTGNYVVLAERLDGKNILSRAAQAEVKTAVSLKKGTRLKFNASLPAQFKSKAVITYRSSNKSVATIGLKGGIIKGKTKGTAIITTTVTIGKNTKVFRTKVTVK